ncbi:MAG: site-2 protease family protein [Lysobacterales bacterium]
MPDKAKMSWRAMAVFLLQMLGGGAFGYFSVTWVLKGGMQLAPVGTAKPLLLACLLLALLVALPLQLAVHELGHALVGRARGGYLLRFVLGPWRCQRTRSGFRWQRVRSLKGIGGFVQTLLPPGKDFRMALSWMLLGGPLANLLLAGLAFLLIWYAPWWPLRVFSIPVALFGLLFGLINLLPFRVGGFLTDGANLWRIWSDPAALEQSQRMARLARASIDGLRPRELDAADIAALDPDQPTGAERFFALLVRATVAEDQGQLQQARTLINRALADWDQLPDGFRQVLALYAANACAQMDRDAPGARAWLAKTEGGLLEDFHIAWVEAQIAEIEGREAERAQALARVRSALDDTVYRGDEKVYRERLAAA